MAAPEPEKLDFTSEHFDPALALTSENVQPPDAKAKPLDNLAQYSSLTAKQRSGQSSQPAATMTIQQTMASLSAQRKERLEAMMLKARTGDSDEEEEEKRNLRRRQTKTRNVLTFMDAAQQKQGPLGVLFRCLRDRIRVKVWTRNYSQVRGICTGYIAAFDKHWNLAMTDVDETYVIKSIEKTVARGKKVVKVTDARILDEEEEEEEDETKPEMEEPVSEEGDEENDQSEEALEKRLMLLKEQLQQISQDNDDDIESEKNLESAKECHKNTPEQCPMQEQKRKENRKNPRRRKRPPPVVRNRHINQLFVRGDNVVIIALLDC